MNRAATMDSSEPIIKAEHLVKVFAGPVMALDDLSFQVRRGEVLVVVGPSGSGKSTLLRCLNSLELVDSGRIVIDGIPYYDGALGDTIPLKKAFADGCDKVVLILTKPEGTVRADSTDRKLARVIRRRYPKAAEQLALRAQHYNEGIALAEQLAAEGKVLIIAPDDTCGVKTLTRDQEALKKLYSKGIRDAQAIEAFIK